MRRVRSALALLLIFLLAGGLLPTAEAAGTERALTILFTHDTHDHFLPMPEESGGTYGGYTRLATVLERERAAAGERVVTLDAGDFSMGSLVQTLYATDAPELRALGAMGYDAVTLGNHEFDYRQQGLADMLTAAKESGDRLPALVQANYTTPAGEGRALTEALADYPVTDYVVLEKGGLRIAVFGLMGVDAHESAPMSDMVFEPIVDAARRVVAEIQEREAADYIICLSHSGTDENARRSEDERLAKAVSGIDVIVSGHTHSTLEEPVEVNDTLIVSCGAYTRNLGVLTVDRGETGPVYTDYRLVPLDDGVPQDPALAALAGGWKAKVGQDYLADYGLTYDQVLAGSPFDVTGDGLGNLIADSYVYAVRQAEGANYVPVDFAVVAAGVIRGDFPKGEMTTADAFQVSSLGSGGDGTPGYPLISVYVTGRELRDAFEVDASVSPIMPAAQLWGAGMTWNANPNRMLFNRVTSSAQVLEDGTQAPIEHDRLYRVVTGLYSGQMLGAVNGKSFGLLTITPKDSTGNPVEDFEDHIIYSDNGAEVKEWFALASYLQSMGTVEGRYAGSEGRKVYTPSWNPIELLKNPNWITLTVLALGLVLLLAAVLVIRRLAGGRTSRRTYRSYRGKRR